MTGSKVSLRTHDAVDPEDLIGDAEGDRNCERDEERPPQIIEKCGKEEGQTEENGCDDEETRAVLSETLSDWATTGPFSRAANLDIRVSGSFQTEQDEPLLLLADYMAGSFNHADVDAVIEKPVAPLVDVRKAVQAFRLVHGSRLQEKRLPFKEIHPLTKMWER